MTNRQKFTEVFDCEIVRRDTGEPVPGHCKILIAESEHFDEWLQKEYEPSAQPGWIPCSERCPDKSEWYLVTAEWDYGLTAVTKDRYVVGEGWTCEVFGAKCLAWMPLPKPWKGD